MQNLKKKAFLALAVSVFSAHYATASEGGIPVVPVGVVTGGGGAAVAPQIPSATTGSAVDTGEITLNSNSTVVMQRGVNEIIPVALSHLNRIVTPFAAPVVKTGSGAEVNVEDNVIYVATNDTAPVTLFINEEGNQSLALNITLVPRKIPSREVFLRLAENLITSGGVGSSKADKWEKSQPYVETIRSIFRGLALGELPQGYSLSKYPSNRAGPACNMTGLSFDFKRGQLLTGHNMQVSVGVVQNLSDRPIEIRESVCGGWDVAAVAAWPNNMLEPNQKSEIYVAERVERGGKKTTKRPSLLGDE